MRPASIDALDPPVELGSPVRESGGGHFADVVIGIAPGAAVGQGHAAADGSRTRCASGFPTPTSSCTWSRGARMRRSVSVLWRQPWCVPQVREIHNLVVLEVDGRIEVSLHLKLPGDPSSKGRTTSPRRSSAILSAVSEVEDVRTHLEPLTEAAAAREVDVDVGAVEQVVRAETGRAPRELRFVRTDDGLVAFLTLGLGGEASLANAHALASAVEERVREAVPGIADVVVHTEP